MLAIYIIRFLSIFFGFGTILVTERLGLMLFGPTVALLASALITFNPMFIFVNASVNNDSLAILLGTVGTYLLVHLRRVQQVFRKKWWRYLSLGLIIGLSIVTKLGLGGLLLLAAAITQLLAWRRRESNCRRRRSAAGWILPHLLMAARGRAC